MWTTAQGKKDGDCTNDCTAMCTTAQGERDGDCTNDCTAMCGLQLKERKMGIVQMIVLNVWTTAQGYKNGKLHEVDVDFE